VPSVRRHCGGALARLTVLILVAGCSSTGPAARTAEEPAPGSASVIDRLVDIGDDRAIRVVCAGEGSPTVVIVPGSQMSHEAWQVVAPADGDTRPSALVPSASAVLPSVAQRTRVCAYDRPGVLLLDGSLSASTLVRQPTTAQQGAEDLAAWLAAAEEPGPYVLVAHSWGGLIAVRFAQDFPDETAGLVLVDPASVHLRDALGPERWQEFLDIIVPMVDGSGREVPSYAGSVDVIAEGPPVRDIPVVVLTADHAFNYGIGEEGTWPAWLAAQEQLAGDLGAEHITGTDSAHLIMIEQPAQVVDAVLRVIDRGRAARSPSTP
jgi:pimeloyl-ACP methyl ester carboxylesterase